MKFHLLCVSILVYVVALRASPYPKYKGCFKDGDPRDLSQKVFHKGQSVRGCVSKCRSLKFMNAGIQFSYLCFCGNTSGRYGRLPDSACNSPCRKKRDKICGGEWANAVYDTGYRKYKPKKWRPRNQTVITNDTSAASGSGDSPQEIVPQESSADGVVSLEMSAQGIPREDPSSEEPASKVVSEGLSPQGSAADAIASLGPAAQMIASLGSSKQSTISQVAQAQTAVPQQQQPTQEISTLESAADVIAALGSASENTH